MSTLLRDVRYAFRTLRRTPGYTLAALLTLVLGIGANTAVFSVVHGILLAPLPFEDPSTLVSIREVSERGRSMDVAWRNFIDWRERSRTFESMAAHTDALETTVLGAAEPLRLSIGAVTEGFLATLGASPLVGRDFLAEEHRIGADPAVMVSYGFWRTHLGGDADLMRHRLNVAGHSARIVGVLPADFDYPAGVDVWIPLELDEQSESRTSHNYTVVARLRDGTSLAAADAELDAITRSFLEEDPGVASEEGFAEYFPRAAATAPLHEALVGETRRPLLVLLSASVLVLLIACTNLASATLARGTGREQEYAVRRSLGAGHGTLIRQLFTESLLLALAGGALAVALAAASIRLLPAVAPAGIPRIDNVGLNGAVVAVALIVTVLTATLFGLLPALRIAEGGFADVLRRGSRAGVERGRHRVWKVLIGVEVALALMLLVGSGLLIRSFRSVMEVQPGFRTTGLLTATLDPPQASYPEDMERRDYYDALLRELAPLPGVAEVGLISSPPLGGSSNGLVELRDAPQPTITTDYLLAGPGTFEALGIPVLRGRTFRESDDERAPHVVVINRAFAELAWPGEDPIGKQTTGGGMDNYWDQEVWATVVGVVGDMRQHDLEREPLPTVYFSYRQRPFRSWTMTAILRPVAGDAAALGPAVREAVARVDPNVPVRLATIESHLANALTPRRFTMLVLGLFAAVALALACVGIWGVVSYAAARRTREIGIRMALGAEPGAVRRLVQRDYLVPAAVGALAGIVLSLALTRVLSGLLFGVEPTDPATFVAVIVVLGAATWLASFVPSLRGTRITPMETMRAE